MIEIEARPSHDGLDGIAPPSASIALRGRDEEWRELTQAFASGRMHHAWLLQGPRGIGKASTAFAFARWVLTEGRAASPEGAGEADGATIRQIAAGSHPNVLHLDRPPAERGEGYRTQITVDEIRRLNQFFRQTAGGGWRIAIVDPADDMNRNAANALLKTLEEPPERSLFLIANHQPGRLLPTIRSRCRVLRFAPLSPVVVEEGATALLPDAGAGEIRSAAAMAGGSLRDALLLLTEGGLEVEARAETLFRQSPPDWGAVQSLADALTQKGREAAWALFLDALLGKLADDARRRMLAGDRDGAEAIARLCQSENGRWREGTAFNLDRKQMLVTFFTRLQAARLSLG